MKLTNYIYIACTLTLASCSKYLEEYSQDKYHISSYRDLDELLIGDCYYPVKNSAAISAPGKNTSADKITASMGVFIHFIGDEMEEQNGGLSGQYMYDVKQNAFGQYTWQQRVGINETMTSFSAENETWKESYRYINVANSIIANVAKLPRSTPDETQGANRVEGEARFLRGVYYFWLVNLYGKPYNPSTAATDLGVPLKLQEEVLDELYKRNTVKEVYDQILVDLTTAEQLLSATGKQKSIYRTDLTAVQLLLSRVYLYSQDWLKAKDYASKVIAARPDLVDLNTAKTAFLQKESVENIFSMGGNDVFRNMCNSVQGFRVSHDLYESYGANDLRKSTWYWAKGDFVGYTKTAAAGVNTATSSTSYYLDQYFNSTFSAFLSPVSDKFLYRTAEAYLNKAEAEAYLKQDANAQATINILRRNRYQQGSSYQVTATGNELIRTIREERRKELALEGQRWFDLRRFGVCETLPESKRIVHNYTLYKGRTSMEMVERRQYVLEANDPGYTLPIPQSVIDFNGGMINNERPVRSFTVIPL